MISRWPSKKRIPSLFGAFILMFISAYSVFMYCAIGANVGDRIGFRQFTTQVPKLEAEGVWWGRMGLALPFLSALVLGFGKEGAKTAEAEAAGPEANACSDAKPHEWLAPIRGYALRLAISAVGSLGFLALLLLLLFAFDKLRIHMG